MLTEDKTTDVQETSIKKCTKITEEPIITEPEEETVECIDEGDQSLAEYKPQIGRQQNPFENDTPTEIDDRNHFSKNIHLGIDKTKNVLYIIAVIFIRKSYR